MFINKPIITESEKQLFAPSLQAILDRLENLRSEKTAWIHSLIAPLTNRNYRLTLKLLKYLEKEGKIVGVPDGHAWVWSLKKEE
jgi:hypothetical protein